MQIGWKVASLSFSIASVRYRAMLPLLALEQANYRCRIFSDADSEQLAGLDLLVFVKSFSPDDLALAQQAVGRGLPVILDLCDNIFVTGYGASLLTASTSPAKMFLAMARIATAVVVTTPPLALEVGRRLGPALPIHVVPDGSETQEALEAMRLRLAKAIVDQRKTLAQVILRRVKKVLGRLQTLNSASKVELGKRLALRALKELHWRSWAKRAYRIFDAVRRSVKARRRQPLAEVESQREINTDTKRILWFGNHGAPYARFGLLDLLEIRTALETIGSEFNVELVVVSNHRAKFEQHIKPLRISATYVEWSPLAIKQQLKLASVVIIPNTLDAFSVCKSSNRTVSALLAGVPVVATATPALEELSSCIALDDFVAGLRLYLSDSQRAVADVAGGQQLIHRLYGQQAIAGAWRCAIEQALSMTHTRSEPDAELVVALNLAQDLDLALPIILQARKDGVLVVAYCNVNIVRKSPRLTEALQANGIEFVMLEDDFYEKGTYVFPASATMLLTVSETNLGPHRFPRKLTEAANAQGLFTATMQHGFENVGLTYSDEFQAAEKIDFAAKRIYLWGGLETLHPKVRAHTRAKCVPMGCSKPSHVPLADLGELLPSGKPIIGVFENLHWARYSDLYRTFFIENVQRLAQVFPNVVFLVKPHHAGAWLTSRFKGVGPKADNIVIADPHSAAWEPFTAPSLMGHLCAIITSTSTVAVDGARQELPVAVVAHQIDLSNYEPLPLLRTEADWDSFVRGVFDSDQRSLLVEQGKAFVQKKLMPDGASERILKDLRAQAQINTRNAAR